MQKLSRLLVPILILCHGYASYSETNILQPVKNISSPILTETRGRLFDRAEYYELLTKDPQLTNTLLRNWYGQEFVEKWSPLFKFSSLDARPLLTDPGIADRSAEFVRFAKDLLSKGQKPSLIELRNAFSAYLGNVEVYRAVVVTDEQFKKISTEGLLADGLYTGGGSVDKWFPPYDRGPIVDASDRVIKNDGISNASISVSEFKEIALGATSLHLAEKLQTGKHRHLFKVRLPEIELMRENQRLARTKKYAPLGQKLDTSVLMIFHKQDNTNYTADWSTGQVEAFVFNAILPEEIESSVLDEDTSWDYEVWDHAFPGMEFLGDVDRPLRKYQINDDP